MAIVDYPKALARAAVAASCIWSVAYDPAFEAAYGFRSLLGAMYLQMYWLMTAKGDVRRCKAPGCLRVIPLDQPKQHGDHWKMNDRNMGYRTRRHRLFCSSACKQRDYVRRKRQQGHDNHGVSGK